HYMSPEQATSREITAKTDLYSAGVLLFELFTVSLPFQGDSIVSLALMHANDPPPALRKVRPEVPPALERVVMRALAKKPEDRPGSAAEMAAEIRAAVAGVSASPAPPGAAPGGATIRPAPSRAQAVAAPQPPAKRSLALIATAAVIVVGGSLAVTA